MSCQFYGHCALPVLQATASTGGNQCALVMESFAPCRMETAGEKPDWNKCIFNQSPKWRSRAAMIQGWASKEDGRGQLLQLDYPD